MTPAPPKPPAGAGSKAKPVAGAGGSAAPGGAGASSAGATSASASKAIKGGGDTAEEEAADADPFDMPALSMKDMLRSHLLSASTVTDEIDALRLERATRRKAMVEATKKLKQASKPNTKTHPGISEDSTANPPNTCG